MAKKYYNGVEYDSGTDYTDLLNKAVAAGDNEKAAIYEHRRNAKVQGEGLTGYKVTSDYAQYMPKTDTPYDVKTDYSALIQKAALSGDYAAAARYEKQLNAKIKGEGLDYEQSNRYAQYLPENRYTYDPSKNDAYQRANDQATAIYDKIMNRGEFSYDVNKDKLYQQYRDLYAQMGRGAMEDTMGQAAALTGGYGSTYSQNAGQQAYNSYLQKLNEVVPELYTAAYNRYNQEGQNLMNLYSMARSNADNAYERDYNQWYNRLQLERGDEDTAYNRQQTEEQKKLTQEETDYERKQNAWSRLSSLITTTGYQPSNEELAAAGMSANEAAYLRQYYQQQKAAASNKSGGSGGGSRRSRSRSGSGYGGGGTQPGKTDSPSPYAHKPGSGITHNDIDITDASAVKDAAAVAGRVKEMINEGVPIADVNAFIRSASENGLISDDSARRLRYMNNSRK